MALSALSIRRTAGFGDGSTGSQNPRATRVHASCSLLRMLLHRINASLFAQTPSSKVFASRL